jgi:hypothetical protein
MAIRSRCKTNDTQFKAAKRRRDGDYVHIDGLDFSAWEDAHAPWFFQHQAIQLGLPRRSEIAFSGK